MSWQCCSCMGFALEALGTEMLLRVEDVVLPQSVLHGCENALYY